jgi:hypothetical protein
MGAAINATDPSGFSSVDSRDAYDTAGGVAAIAWMPAGAFIATRGLSGGVGALVSPLASRRRVIQAVDRRAAPRTARKPRRAGSAPPSERRCAARTRCETRSVLRTLLQATPATVLWRR